MADSSTRPSSSTANKFISLRSSDGEIFEVEEAVAVQSQTIKNLIEDTSANLVPLENVSSQILSKVITYCKKHAKDENFSPNEKKIWDRKFLQVDLNTLFELCLAANYLDIKNLLDLVCQYIADFIKDKSVEEVREIFGIENDFTPEEEANIRIENQWAFE